MSGAYGANSEEGRARQRVLNALRKVKAAVLARPRPGVNDLRAMRALLSSPYLLQDVAQASEMPGKEELIALANDLHFVCGDKKTVWGDTWERVKDIGRNGGVVVVGVGLAGLFTVTAPLLLAGAGFAIIYGAYAAGESSVYMKRVAIEKKLYEDLEKLAGNISERLS